MRGTVTEESVSVMRHRASMVPGSGKSSSGRTSRYPNLPGSTVNDCTLRATSEPSAFVNTVSSVPSPVVGCVALEWGMASFPEMIRPIINDVIDGALTNAAPLKPAIVREHSRSQLLVLDPAKLDIGQGPLGRWFNVTSLKIPGDAGAAISLAGTLTL